MRMRKEKDFLTLFDERTGQYLRTGIIKEGRDTGEDPFMSSFPELLDVGIMGHCRHCSQFHNFRTWDDRADSRTLQEVLRGSGG